MPPKPRDRTTHGHTPSSKSQQVHNAAMEGVFSRQPRRSLAWHFHPAHDPYAITAPIDPHSDSAGWGTEDNLRGRPRGVLEYNDF